MAIGQGLSQFLGRSGIFQVPVVFLLVSVRGLRAAIACQGVLSELSLVGLLDMVTYIAGLSGSTWREPVSVASKSLCLLQQVACSVKSHPGPYDESILGNFGIRIHFEISDEEKVAVKNRGENIWKALKSLRLSARKVPVVSVLLSGGGLRAAIACQGVLSELSCVGLLDMVTYIAGVSGSIWCMSSLYNKSDGWTDLKKEENEFRRRLQDSWDISVALDKLCEAAESDDYSLTDFWSYTIVYYLTKELLESHLSQVRKESKMGTVPYPIFATIDHDLKFCGNNAWFEFTPDSAGYSPHGTSTLGAYVHTTHCGSEFEEGMLIKQKPERNFSYLRGLCGSALADMNIIRKTLWDFLMKFIFCSDTQEELCTAHPNGNKYSSECSTLTKQMMEHFRDRQIQIIQDFLEKALHQHLANKSKTFLNFFWKTIRCLFRWKWGTTNNFLYKYGNAPTSLPTDQKCIYLMDAGLAINSAYPLVLPPVRNSDIILSFDFSEGDPFETIKATEKYCKTHHIPFPSVDDSKLDQEAKAPSDFYIFKGEKAPVVMHFPLFNKVNCGSEEDIKRKKETYKTFRLTSYSDKEVCELLDLSKANIRNNKGPILKKILHLAS
ncbi:cytosolic phospholipase A2 gamma-like [Notamacropus eugenii]|uniref:cytosolic phospholipase A2 gamma-like n=1 Tax=Notamacropus eugenii TaxID=9315 RepID=UPI003B67AE44